MHNFKKLKVWEKAMELSQAVYRLTEQFPSEERFSLTSQIRRCAISIPSNIAEGSSRDPKKDFARFLSISIGSSFELETQLMLGTRLNYLSRNEFEGIEVDLNEIQKMLNTFIQNLKNNDV